MDNRMKSVDQKEFLGGQGMVHFDHILEADATIDDNHERTLTLKPGEHYFTPSGKGHSLTNLEEDELQVMALIIYDHEKQD